VEPTDASPLEAVKRELREETGYGSDDFLETGTLSANPATHTNLTHCYVARQSHRIAPPLSDATEHIEIIPVSLQQAFAYAVQGQLPQALHVGSLFLALATLGRLRLS
jgi:8-oxo-dGTP pyrophosphatase MutT (NUDIX family)